MRKVLADLHTHTVASGHAYSTLQEMAQRASELGLQILGVTEHGPSIPGTCDPLYFMNYLSIPREMYGVRLLMGAELNILDTKGALDLGPKYYRQMDIRIAGIHSLCYTGGTKEECTEGVVAAIANPWVNVISHPGDGTAELDFEPLVIAAGENHTLLEINNHSLHPARHKTVARENNLEILRLCKKHDVPVILGSDAHISFMIADYARLYPLIDEVGFPDELIMNYWPERLLDYLGIQK